MAGVILFHHAQGLTDGVRAFADRLLVAEGDLDAARELVGTVDGAELFLYSGDQHLFTDDSLPAYDEAAATSLEQRGLRLLDDVGST